MGANALERKVSGNIVVNMTPLTASTDRIAEPTRMPTQIIAKPQSSSSPYAASASRTEPRIRQPTTSPVSDITMMPMKEWVRLDMLRPTRIAAGLIGSDRNRSTIPLSMSAVRPIATMNDANAIVWPMIPPSSHSR